MSRRATILSALGLALAMAATGCGGSGKKVAAAADTTTSTTDGPRAAYTACLKQHGVDLPDRPRPTTADGSPATTGTRPPRTPRTTVEGAPASSTQGSRPTTSLPPGVDQAKFDAARQACQSLLPAGGGQGNGGAGNGPQSQAFQLYASCLRDHGVTVPAGGGPGGLNRDDPAFKAADSVCAPLRPSQP